MSLNVSQLDAYMTALDDLGAKFFTNFAKFEKIKDDTSKAEMGGEFFLIWSFLDKTDKTPKTLTRLG